MSGAARPSAGGRLLPARARTQQSRGDTARAALLGAAERVFARAGFNGATTAAIAEAAGVPKSNLHYHFGSKHELYHEVLTRTLHDWLVPMDSLVAEADPRTALASYIGAKMAMSAARPDASLQTSPPLPSLPSASASRSSCATATNSGESRIPRWRSSGSGEAITFRIRPGRGDITTMRDER